MRVDPAFPNGDHTTLDGKGNVVIVTGTNPNHYMANWMFGFISVVGGDDGN